MDIGGRICVVGNGKNALCVPAVSPPGEVAAQGEASSGGSEAVAQRCSRLPLAKQHRAVSPAGGLGEKTAQPPNLPSATFSKSFYKPP